MDHWEEVCGHQSVGIWETTMEFCQPQDTGTFVHVFKISVVYQPTVPVLKLSLRSPPVPP